MPKIQTTGPKPLTDQEIIKAFPQARRIIPAKIREWKVVRKSVLDNVRAAIERGKGYDPDTRAVCFELVMMILGLKLDEIDRHLTRLWRLKNLMDGKESADQITDEMIERARSFPIESLDGLEMRKAGRLYRGLCPFHSERGASFTVYPDGGGFFCFGCGKGGDAIAFSQLKYGHSFKQAVRFLAGGMAS